jgi:hypothetical protein
MEDEFENSVEGNSPLDLIAVARKYRWRATSLQQSGRPSDRNAFDNTRLHNYVETEQYAITRDLARR